MTVAAPEESASARVAERLEELTREVRGIAAVAPQETGDDPIAKLSATLDAINKSISVHSRTISELLNIVRDLASDIDRLSHRSPPSD